MGTVAPDSARGDEEQDGRSASVTATPKVVESVPDAKQMLEELRIETMYNMVETIEHAKEDTVYTANLLYLTNSQASKISGPRMQNAINALKFGNPGMIIRLMPSLKGPSPLRNEPLAQRGLNRYFTDSEESPESTHEVEAQMTRLMLDLILPLARRNRALIVGAQGCDMMNAFVQVAAPWLRGREHHSQFAVLYFSDIPALLQCSHIGEDVSSSTTGQLLKKVWTDELRESTQHALRRRFGEDEAFWPHAELPVGPTHYIVFKGTSSGELRSEIGQMFMNRMIESFAENIPVLVIQSFGFDSALHRLSPLSDHVGRGLPLLLVDCRKRLHDMAPSEESQEKKLERIISQMKALQSKLNQIGKVDFYHCANLAFLKHGFSCITGDHKAVEETKGGMWLCEVIRHGKQPASAWTVQSQAAVAPSLARPDELAVEMVRHFMEYMGDAIEQVNAFIHEAAQRALDEVVATDTWDAFIETWEKNYCQIRNFCFHKYERLHRHNFLQQNAIWIKLEKQKGPHTKMGHKVLRIHKPASAGIDVKEAQARLAEVITAEFKDKLEHIARHNSKSEVAESRQIWLDLYNILRAPNVRACNLFDLRRCELELMPMASMDRLPHENSHEALLLLRAAWTLHDTFSGNARYYKYLSKCSYMCIVLVSVLVVLLVTMQQSVEVFSSNEFRYLMLGLALFEGFISAWVIFLDPHRKWTKLKGGALLIMSQIWQFRTRTGAYRGRAFGLNFHDRLQSERAAEKQLLDILELTCETVLQAAGLKNTNFFSNSTFSVDLAQNGARKLRASQVRHQQFDIGQAIKPLEPGQDDHHSPATPDDYLRWRLIPAMEFYQKRIPSYFTERMIIQFVILSSSIISAVMAASGHAEWIAVLTCAANGLLSWQEFANINKKLDRHSAVVDTLNRLVIRWQSLTEVAQQNVVEIESLIGSCEGALSSENSAWVSEAQLSARLLEETAARQQDLKPMPSKLS